ncbi:MAG: DUF4198 domain-containing protein [Sphingomicrobium sp.]
MKIRHAALSLAMFAAPGIAHDFWLQPFRYQVAPGAPFAATFQVGHAAARQRWGNDIRRIEVFAEFRNGRRSDRRAALRNGGPADVVMTFPDAGLRVLAMQTSYSFSNLPAIRFNDYAREEGLAAVLAHRQRTGKGNAAGLERYSRRAKTLVQVGKPSSTDSTWATRPVGLKLEIVPRRNPYALGASRLLPVDVLYNGRPLANAKVKLTSLEADEKPFAIALTDRAGRASFRIPQTGNWLLNVVWAEPVRGIKNADFDTTFSSLTFGYPAKRPRP